MWSVLFNNLNLHVIQLLHVKPCDDDRACRTQTSFRARSEHFVRVLEGHSRVAEARIKELAEISASCDYLPHHTVVVEGGGGPNFNIVCDLVALTPTFICPRGCAPSCWQA